MRRAPLLAAAALAVAASAAPFARAQDPVELTPAQIHSVRGKLAWRRAVWAVNADGYQRAATELQKCREDASTRSDFTTLFLLGVSHLRLGQLAEAEPPINDARLLDPTYPGFWLIDAMRAAALRPDDEAEALRAANDALENYGNFLGGMPKDGPFADEFRFLGLVLRGTLRARMPGERDNAVADLNEARALAKSCGATPSSEVTSILAHVHQSLNQTEEAKRLVLEAMARDPAEASHYLNFGLILAGTYEDNNARLWFEQALARRANFPEAHLKLAYLASRANDLSRMRIHLEAAQSMFEGRGSSGSKSDARAQAEIDSGFGTYYRSVGIARSAAGDDAGARDAYLKAEKHFRAALGKEPGCIQALNSLIQILGWTGAPQSEVDLWKRRLDDTRGVKPKVQPYKSTFC